MFKNRKFSKIIWISGVYTILIIILCLVVNYKVKWENLDLNTYLYFYNCNGLLCTSSIEQDDYYGKILCKNDECPYIKEVYNNYLILSKNNESFIYDYVNDTTLYDNSAYVDYKFSTDKKSIIVKDKEGFYSVVDYEDNVLVDAYNKTINDYRNGYFTYIVNDLYGIANLEKNIKIDAKYEDVILVNSNTYAYFEDDQYHMATFDEKDMPLVYDYVYAFADYLVVIANKKLDILDNNLKSQLLMKIETEYEYSREKERETLNFSFDGKYLIFNIYNNNTFNKYIYDYKNNKILS